LADIWSLVQYTHSDVGRTGQGTPGEHLAGEGEGVEV
jgi:hypothetical protein